MRRWAQNCLPPFFSTSPRSPLWHDDTRRPRASEDSDPAAGVCSQRQRLAPDDEGEHQVRWSHSDPAERVALCLSFTVWAGTSRRSCRWRHALTENRPVYGMQGRGLEPGKRHMIVLTKWPTHTSAANRGTPATRTLFARRLVDGRNDLLEIARRLRAAGEEVPIVSMLDSHFSARTLRLATWRIKQCSTGSPNGWISRPNS